MAVAGLISHPLNVWFATALTEEGLKRISSFKIMRNKASRDRTLPKCPVSMRGVIRIKKFTNGAVSYTLTFFFFARGIGPTTARGLRLVSFLLKEVGV